MSTLPSFGNNTQAEGGRGDPYVGTGWNNLENYLNKGNVLDYGAKDYNPINGDPAARTAPQEWMFQAAGSPARPVDKSLTPSPIPHVPDAPPIAQPTYDPGEQPEFNPGDEWQAPGSKPRHPTVKQKNPREFDNLNAYLAW